MEQQKVLVANRGEIAIRIMRAAAEADLYSVAIYAEDDAQSLHCSKANDAIPLEGKGAAAYLDIEQIVSIAKQHNCHYIHPGYGFLSENPSFAQRCAKEGIQFIGPKPETLQLFANKSQAKQLATQIQTPILTGTIGPTSPEQAVEFFRSNNGSPIIIKAIAGGGGRGMRVAHQEQDIADYFTRCESEAKASFGDGSLYVEKYIANARHIEVQIIGDGEQACHLYERECTLQRRHQKLIEIAPSPSISESVREKVTQYALDMALKTNYRSLGTFEFLVDLNSPNQTDVYFIEANPRLQVEHTVTEAILGMDLVLAQFKLAKGHSLQDLGIIGNQPIKPRGFAIQLRVNSETLLSDGSIKPSSGTLTQFDMPSGLGVRVDTAGYAGAQTNPYYDSLLAKLICHSDSAQFEDVVKKAYRALCEMNIQGVHTNIPLLQALLNHPSIQSHHFNTLFIEEHLEQLLEHKKFNAFHRGNRNSIEPHQMAGARVDRDDPLAVLNYGKGASSTNQPSSNPTLNLHEGSVCAPLQGTVVECLVKQGDTIKKGQPLLVMEAMKMEHLVNAPVSGLVENMLVTPGDTLFEGHLLIELTVTEGESNNEQESTTFDLETIRNDLKEVHERHAAGHDDRRPEATEKRHKKGFRTTRENIEDLCDPDTFLEYGALTIAAQRKRFSQEDLIKLSPADGLVCGVGSVNGDQFPVPDAQCIVMSYDYTVFAGTQGMQNHRKKDRMFELAEKQNLPIIFFTEGGGGRPGDTEGVSAAGLDCLAFQLYGKLSGKVPLIGIANGRCFAGNAALLGSCDVIIATKSANIGMGGPAMIEGGGLGVFAPEEIGPINVQVNSGVVDIAVADEAEAVQIAKQYIAYFQGDKPQWQCEDQRTLRHLIPENRLRVYEVRDVIQTLADHDSLLELRAGFGKGMITAFIRIEGKTVGVIANNPKHLGGAIDAHGADKAARFMQLCDGFDIPILFLCDTPGIMVGPEVEKTGLVRHAARLFVTASSLSVPFFTIVLRKAYGLGALAMAGGSMKTPSFVVSWPTGEFGGMGLEGAVKLGFRKQLEAIEDPNKRKETFDSLVQAMYERGKAVNTATYFEFDEVIDPAESRTWISMAIASQPSSKKTGNRRPFIDTW